MTSSRKTPLRKASDTCDNCTCGGELFACGAPFIGVFGALLSLLWLVGRAAVAPAAKAEARPDLFDAPANADRRTRFALKMLATYHRFVSVRTPAVCAYEPTCSRYAAQALQRFGFWRGQKLARARLARCRPGTAGGVDPVPARGDLM